MPMLKFKMPKISTYISAVIMAATVALLPVGPDGYQSTQAFFGIPFSLGDVSKVALGWTGGTVSKSSLEFCLIPVPGLPFPIPYPFIYVEIDTTVFTPPIAALHSIPYPTSKLYYLFLVSQLYREFQLQPKAKTIMNYVRGADAALRSVCENGASLPKADGVIYKVGTTCAKNTGSCKLQSLQQNQQQYNQANDPNSAMGQFDPSQFPGIQNFCSPNSPDGQCIPMIPSATGGNPPGCNATCVAPPSNQQGKP